MRRLLILPVLLPSFMLLACGPGAQSLGRVSAAPPSMILGTRLLTPDGNSLGEVELLQLADGVQFVVNTKGLPAGQYGLHLHAVGRCTPPDFASAGPHFNPEGRQHGRDNPQGAHAGDLPNLVVTENGTGSLNILLPALRLADGAAPVLDGDGAAVVLHARPDDGRTDPAGNAGARIACGEVRRPPQ